MEHPKVKQRLEAYLAYKGVTKAEFGRTIGVSSAFVSSIRVSIQPDKIKKISEAYPDLNTEWLLTGKDPMLRSQERGGVAVADRGGAAAVGGSAVSGDIGDSIRLLVEEMRREREAHTSQVDRLLAIIERMQGEEKKP